MSETTETGNHEGTIVYLENGQAVQLIEWVHSGAIVCPIFEDQYDNEIYGHPRFEEIVFKEPPTPKFDAMTQPLHDAIARLQAEIVLFREQRDAARTELTAVTAQCKHIPVLRNIIAYLDGQITHYVISDTSGWVRILTLEETMQSDGWEKWSRLVSLHAKSGRRDLEWEINTYGDGSGRSEHVVPCMGLEMAQSEARSAFDRLCVEWRTGKKVSPYVAGYLVRTATALGLDIPDDVARIDALDDLKSAQSRANEAKKNLDKQAEELRKAELAAARFIGTAA